MNLYHLPFDTQNPEIFLELPEDDEILAEVHLRLGITYATHGNETLAEVELEILKDLDWGRAGVLGGIMSI